MEKVSGHYYVLLEPCMYTISIRSNAREISQTLRRTLTVRDLCYVYIACGKDSLMHSKKFCVSGEPRESLCSGMRYRIFWYRTNKITVLHIDSSFLVYLEDCKHSLTLTL